MNESEGMAASAPTAADASLSGPLGFAAGGMAAGIKRSGKPDLAAILSDRPAVAAGVTTTNRFPGAPVLVVRERLAAGRPLRGVIVNAGISNVCDGERGLANAREMTLLAARAAGVGDDAFLVGSTGVIGVPLPMEKIRAATPKLFAGLTTDGWDAFARAIMTTDMQPKLSRRTVTLTNAAAARAPTILGVCKGSGMIEPNMATMLAYLVTDYPVDAGRAGAIVRRAVDRSFNRVTIDGDTSTSDMAILLANGAALDRAAATAADDERFEAALGEVCEELARMIALDGEGATHLITIDVEGAEDDAAAHRVAKTIANSPLVKTAVFGHDPNWGRICAAAGRAGVAFDPADVTLRLQGTTIFQNGAPVAFDREALSQALRARDVALQLRIGDGPGSARVWTCDLTYDYVKINAEYTT
jgi:glutamate N-acetyltransferase/amino-acid N-acetyltransferase